ncbi:magnesium transporter CorA family protein [Wukongibacter baidiensis]|uniref:magnesium transporter CorA family protein n=1 Tax=Wukongibacter baidiensis TaxID=1723361 RepID=UPI003D7F3E70
MIQIYKTVENELLTLNTTEDGIWVNLVNPSFSEIKEVSEKFNIEINDLKAALDKEERARIETEENYFVILVDVPITEEDSNSEIYSTIPLGIILAKGFIITVCTKELPLLNEFINKKVRGFFTFKKTRFILQILHKNASYFLRYLRLIDRKSNRIEEELHNSMKNKELFHLLALEKSLVYFSTSLRANEIVLEKMLRLENIKKYPDDKDLLEDVIIENKQAIEMANIYSKILSETRDAFSSVISNNLNIVMKFLTSITIVMSIPTIIASFYGMNVALPMSKNPNAFLYILLITFILSVVSAFIMAKKKMF